MENKAEKQNLDKENETKEKRENETEKEKEAVDLAKRLTECERQRDEYLRGWQRERAEFLNYKKEEIERIEALLKYANEELILKILPILDNIYLAEKELPEELKGHQWVEGVWRIKEQILGFLKQQGVEEIKVLGEKFDPHLMEATEEVAVEEKNKGSVVEVVQNGYRLHGKLIRPAKVKIAK